MARALLGYLGSGPDQALSVEIARLRRRVEELQDELADLRAARPSTLDPTLDLELHRLAENAEPALA